MSGVAIAVIIVVVVAVAALAVGVAVPVGRRRVRSLRGESGPRSARVVTLSPEVPRAARGHAERKERAGGIAEPGGKGRRGGGGELGGRRAPPEPGGQGKPGIPEEPEPLAGKLGKSRGFLGRHLATIRSRRSIDDATWAELEEALLGADVGLATTDVIVGHLREAVTRGDVNGPDELLHRVKAEIVNSFSAAAGSGGDGAERETVERQLNYEKGRTNVWLFVGVNGVGKTTTIGKVASAQLAMGRSVLLAAADTFRAAATEQLVAWGSRTGVEVVRGREGGDPGAVVFDAIEKAGVKGYDIVIADTAGRLHNNVNLVEELKKVWRVATRAAGQVDEVLLVLDATTGQNGLVQARQFTEAVGVTGIVLTKLDGTARGGIVVAIERELGVPVKLIGVGEGVHDLAPFDPVEFTEALFN